MYKAIVDFADLQDKEHIYKVGDIFPRPNVEVSEERIRELSTGLNKLGRPLIGEIPPQTLDSTPRSVQNDENNKKPIQEENSSKKGSEDVAPKRVKKTNGETVVKKPRTRRKKNAD